MKIYKLLHLLIIAIAATSCGIHELPEDGSFDVSVSLTLDFKTDFPQYQTIFYSKSSEEFDVRYTVVAYPEVNGIYSNVPMNKWVFTKDDVNTLNNTVDMSLPARNYRLMVWTDYVSQSTTNDLYYTTESFNSIKLQGLYSGNNDFRDAFMGTLDINVASSEKINSGNVSGVVEMERPLAKFNVIATDVAEYTEEYISQMRNQGKGSDPSLVKAINYSGYRAEIAYVGYLPCEFDMFQNKPIDSTSGVKFSGAPRILDDGSIELGFDYIMVNGKESSVIIGINIYDDNNSLISTVESITVPLKRSQLTTIRGKFLTHGASSGIGINHEFDGEYNVIIN